MKYKFNDEEKQTISKLQLDFDPLADLSEADELKLLEELDDAAAKVGYDTIEGELYLDVYTSMAIQAQQEEVNNEIK